MGLLSRLIGGIRDMFFPSNKDIGKIFGVELISSDKMNYQIERWDAISRGEPPWLDKEDDIRTVNMAKTISDYRARLTTLGVDIACSGSARADAIQKIIKKLLKQLPKKLPAADCVGGMIIKWNGKSWDFVMNGQFGITAKDDDGNIRGAIFSDQAKQGGDTYTRLEYHRFERDGLYYVSNKAFKNRRSASGTMELGMEVPLTYVEAWADMLPETPGIANLENPLFGYFRVPGSNKIDPDSPLGVSVFAGAEYELEAVDKAISRKDGEVEDSKHVTFTGQQVVSGAAKKGVKLPRYVRGLGMGVNDADTSAIKEHVPTMLTDQRIKDINFDLSLAGVQCGFSEGVFVLDGQTGMVTATQVESDDRDTIQTIKDDRDALKDAIEEAIMGADALMTLYNMAPLGDYELNFAFQDITYNHEEDKQSWKYYVSQNWVPAWVFLMKFEGLTEEDAKAMTAEANPPSKGLFGVE